MEPTYVAPDCTHSYHMIPLTYKAEKLDGLDRERFIEAMNAEGARLFHCVTTPIHLRPRHLDHAYYTKGCPWECPHAKREIQYCEGDCPVAERRCREEELNMTGSLIGTSQKLLDQIIEAFVKVTENADEIRRS